MFMAVLSRPHPELKAYFFHISPGIVAGSPMKRGKNREKSGTSPGRGQNKVGKRVGGKASDSSPDCRAKAWVLPANCLSIACEWPYGITVPVGFPGNPRTISRPVDYHSATISLPSCPIKHLPPSLFGYPAAARLLSKHYPCTTFSLWQGVVKG